MGWTKSFKNTDKPRGQRPFYGTGDHEYFFSSSEDDFFQVSGSDGTEYTNCEKTAIHVREANTGLPWWALTNSFTLLFSKSSNYKLAPEHNDFKDKTYSKVLKPNYG